jgi:hypothetical protein
MPGSKAACMERAEDDEEIAKFLEDNQAEVESIFPVLRRGQRSGEILGTITRKTTAASALSWSSRTSSRTCGTLSSYCLQGVYGRVPLPHPRRRLRDQHAVVQSYSTPCVCAQYGAYAVRVGIEPFNAALALPDRHFPAVGLCSLPGTPTTFSSN